jgi:kynureninase
MRKSEKALQSEARDLDAGDELATLRSRFHVPEGVIYLDGNSLGLMQRGVPERLADVAAREWSEGLIRSWNAAGWMKLPFTAGDRIAPLIGAGAGEVVVGDSTSVNIFKCLAAGLRASRGRRVILVEAGEFPTDAYVAQGLAGLVPGIEVRRAGEGGDIARQIDESVAVLVLSHIHYRSALIRDMTAVTAAAHRAGALVLWDLSHSAGVLPIDVKGADADFAVGCTYKYLNGGPGAPAYTYVAPRLAGEARQPLAGWLGHERPFAFSDTYEPGAAIRRFLCGTPQVLSLAALDESLKIWSRIDLAKLRAKGERMTELFIRAVESMCSGHRLGLAVPREGQRRGNHVSFTHPMGYAVMQALIDRGVIGDFRAPDVIRFGFAPLYLSFGEALRAAEILAEVLDRRLWDEDRYKQRAEVT